MAAHGQLSVLGEFSVKLLSLRLGTVLGVLSYRAQEIRAKLDQLEQILTSL